MEATHEITDSCSTDSTASTEDNRECRQTNSDKKKGGRPPQWLHSGATDTPLRIYNTLTGRKELFVPLEPNNVKMYVCGITVYDFVHIGHARTFVTFDVISRYLRAMGYDLTFVCNHTDVDDKIIKRATELGEEPLKLSQRFIDALEEDMALLGVQPADIAPKVSTHMQEIQGMITKLLHRGMAYVVEGGDVFYRVNRFDGYGKLSGNCLHTLRTGNRIEEDPRKENQRDFALWKAAKEGEPFWNFPDVGPGRPGWHIECSAMSYTHLGESFDIHGGGSDLKFPHHENEIAQSEGVTGKPFAKYWLHAGMINVARDDSQGKGSAIVEKMSKSLGNFWTVRDIRKVYDAEVVRYFMLTTHYRSDLIFSRQMMEEAHGRVEFFYTALQGIDRALSTLDPVPQGGEIEHAAGKRLVRFMGDVHKAMRNDFNAPAALVHIGELAKFANGMISSKTWKKLDSNMAYTLVLLRASLVEATGLLGILQRSPMEALHELRTKRAAALGINQAEIEAALSTRDAARSNEDWSGADAIRRDLAALGVELMDEQGGGTSWRIAKNS